MMKVLHGSLRLLEAVNNRMIWVGRQIAWVLVFAMVATILLQVFCRYVLSNALPWPEEVARALMIWMMALVAAGAYRTGGFVAIEMLHDFIPQRLAQFLKLTLLVISALVLFKLSTLGLEFFDRGFRTRAASFQLSRAWIYLAMPVCFITMLMVNVELILKNLLGSNIASPETEAARG
ncbi:Putative TRAP-type C4-dicarboxylate transport system, small permease component DctQ [Vibrio nigripulchritudo SFn27]|uniref:TRAP transporter small permease protein n=1 Tax=Vibrio nigripulchritudo TaxID=28173 RepID=U4KAH1_9VIBR|nr:TRAP transporter small permease [Vibrio nigripulchritudo]CCN82175.1 Putative TRAP-type C4-dicarboxylate transport system, small permease component DctQ [Vibrio nigripulchritudo BLFn1]CCN90786.1 Putative TRAP-type C4-dicarboxylate transport system, small permease component DctQ [Vibrio nigripulchritudo SFn27]CCN93136.1 Putative TRAP-type C4-dicarboxylate transport system, small permease component DctQ [Vibrio nigripulchritudo ENn2]CCO41501.1 Putative TRAP-type C4-dicarboxylate transport syste